MADLNINTGFTEINKTRYAVNLNPISSIMSLNRQMKLIITIYLKAYDV